MTHNNRGVSLLITVLLTLTLYGCDASSNTGTAVSTTAPAATAAPAKHFAPGQVIKVGDTWQVTVNGVKTSQGDDFTKPSAGNQFVIVNVTVTNVSASEQNISSLLNFKLKDADGVSAKTAFLSSGVQTAPDGKVAAGDKARGDLVYEVPTAQKHLTFAFAPDITSAGETIWDITV